MYIHRSLIPYYLVAIFVGFFDGLGCDPNSVYSAVSCSIRQMLARAVYMQCKPSQEYKREQLASALFDTFDASRQRLLRECFEFFRRIAFLFLLFLLFARRYIVSSFGSMSFVCQISTFSPPLPCGFEIFTGFL